MNTKNVDMLALRNAIEASWQPDSAYEFVCVEGNPAYNQCHVTALVVNHYFPEAQVVEGRVRTNDGLKKHFWNVISTESGDLHIDLTWQQFPHGSRVESWKTLGRGNFHNHIDTTERFERLLARVRQNLES